MIWHFSFHLFFLWFIMLLNHLLFCMFILQKTFCQFRSFIFRSWFIADIFIKILNSIDDSMSFPALNHWYVFCMDGIIQRYSKRSLVGQGMIKTKFLFNQPRNHCLIKNHSYESNGSESICLFRTENVHWWEVQQSIRHYPCRKWSIQNWTQVVSIIIWLALF